MIKTFETIEATSGVIMLFGFAMFLGALLYEFSLVLAVITFVSMMVAFLTATAEWFYDKGKKDAPPTEEESE